MKDFRIMFMKKTMYYGIYDSVLEKENQHDKLRRIVIKFTLSFDDLAYLNIFKKKMFSFFVKLCTCLVFLETFQSNIK